MKILKGPTLDSASGTPTYSTRPDVGTLFATPVSSRNYLKKFTFSLICAVAGFGLAAHGDQRIPIKHSPFELNLEAIKQPIHFTHSSAEGSIVVEGQQNNTVEIQLSDLDDDWDPEDGRAYVQVNAETGQLSLQMNGDLWESDLKVLLPRSASVSLRSSDGEIEVNGLNGDIDCATADGNINLLSLTGSVSAESADGNIYLIQQAPSMSPVSLSTSDGNIRLRLDPDSEAEITAAVIDGKVSYSLEGQNRTLSSNDKGANKWERLLGSQKHTVRVGNAKTFQTIRIHSIDGNISISNKPQHQ